MADIVEVAYGHAERQWLIQVRYKKGMTIQSAIQQSGLPQEIPSLDLSECKVGIFGQLGQLDQAVQPGDRVEIYRPLLMDPKQARRQRARNKI